MAATLIKAQIAGRVEAAGLRVLADWIALPPGERVLSGIETAIQSVRCMVVFWGNAGWGPWHELEVDLAVSRERCGDLRVIPVLLPCVSAPLALPGRLRVYSYVDLRTDIRKSLSDPGIQDLIGGIKAVLNTSEPPLDSARPRLASSPDLHPASGPDDVQSRPEAANPQPSGKTHCVNEVTPSFEHVEAEEVSIIGNDGDQQVCRNTVNPKFRHAKFGTIEIIGNRTHRNLR